MKRLVKYPLKLAWRATGPVRRPLARRVELWLDRYLALASQAMSEEANLVLDFAAAELERLQLQVESLRIEAGMASATLAVVDAAS